jgi:hypothetical protein
LNPPTAKTTDQVPQAEQFFEALRELSPLRVISPSGPSLFEAICELGPFGVADGMLNAMTPAYHWHLRLDRIGFVVSKDEIHARSGRRVLFFELRERPDEGSDERPFLWIYVHREKGRDFEPEREAAFARLHRVFAPGVLLGSE